MHGILGQILLSIFPQISGGPYGIPELIHKEANWKERFCIQDPQEPQVLRRSLAEVFQVYVGSYSVPFV